MGDQLVHQRQRQRAVGAGQQLQVLVALLGGFGPARVDAHQFGAGAFGLQGIGPEVQVRGDRVAAPDQDQPAVGVLLDMHAELAAIGGCQRVATGAGADRAVEQRGTETVKEPRRHALALHQTHRAGIAVGQQGLRVAAGDPAQAHSDVVQRVIPTHRLEAAGTFRTDALERLQHALGVVGALGVTADLGAQRAVRGRVRRVALDANGAATLDRDAHRAGVGAIVRAGGVHAAGGGLGAHAATIAQPRARRRVTGRAPAWPLTFT